MLRDRRGVVAAMVVGMVASGLANGAWASREVERRVYRPHATVAPRATSSPTGLTPAQVKAAYGFSTSPNAGAGETVAVVAPYDHPRIEHDLNEFSRKFGLPPCTKSNGCFRKVDHRGGKNWPARNKLWSMEVALDVEWVHAIAPGAKILLVEAKSDRLSDMLKAHDYATRRADYVSNSWGLPEFSGQSRHNYHFNKPGVSIFVASGDDGAAAGPGYPATAPGVIAVGGTRLTGIGTASFAETGWSGSGGGCSRYETAHPAQAAFAGYAAVKCAGKRAAPDVALVGDPRSGVSVYNSYKTEKPWTTLGGTSAAAPMWAARAAASGLVVDAKLLYSTPSVIPLRDITAGSNGLPALPGFDLVTGLGSWTDSGL
ncbi:MAG: S8 family serine peptidase [Actinomycetota bacterium]